MKNKININKLIGTLSFGIKTGLVDRSKALISYHKDKYNDDYLYIESNSKAAISQIRKRLKVEGINKVKSKIITSFVPELIKFKGVINPSSFIDTTYVLSVRKGNEKDVIYAETFLVRYDLEKAIELIKENI